MEDENEKSSFQKEENHEISKLNMSDLYYENNTSEEQQKRPGVTNQHHEESQELSESWKDEGKDDEKDKENDKEEEKSLIKISIKHIEEDEKKARSRNDIVMSAVSFSKFEAISDPSEHEESEYLKSPSNKVENIRLNSREIIKRLPTSAKIVSSKKIVDDPVEILPYAGVFQTVTSRKINLKIEQNFEYRLISKIEIVKKFFDFCILKGMEVKDNEDIILATKKVPFFKIAIKLCFPTSDVDPEIYEFDYSTDNKGSINKLSGDENKFEAFKEEFLVSLWISKYLQARSPQENIRYFMKFCNSPFNQTKISSLPLRTSCQISSIKENIEEAISEVMQGIKSVGRWSDETFNTENMMKIRRDLKHIENRLINIYESEMAKEQKVMNNIEKNENLFKITPAVEKALISEFYTCIELDEIVKKHVITEKAYEHFEKKKMIIKGSLSSLDICKYLEIEDTYKSCIDSNESNEIMREATKILASLSYSNYPSPPQIVECVSLFKQSLQKDMRGLWQGKSNSKVKFSDDTNGDRTMFQLFIYCLIKCNNREIYPTILVASIFNNAGDDCVQALGVDALATVAMLKKAMIFIQNEWEL